MLREVIIQCVPEPKAPDQPSWAAVQAICDYLKIDRKSHADGICLEMYREQAERLQEMWPSYVRIEPPKLQKFLLRVNADGCPSYKELCKLVKVTGSVFNGDDFKDIAAHIETTPEVYKELREKYPNA